jgi:hypothetical protein
MQSIQKSRTYPGPWTYAGFCLLIIITLMAATNAYFGVEAIKGDRPKALHHSTTLHSAAIQDLDTATAWSPSEETGTSLILEDFTTFQDDAKLYPFLVSSSHGQGYLMVDRTHAHKDQSDTVEATVFLCPISGGPSPTCFKHIRMKESVKPSK